MGTRTSSKAKVSLEVQEKIAGLRKHLAGQTVVVLGQTIAVDDLIDELLAYLAQLNATTAAHAGWLQQVQAQRTLEAARIDPLQTALDRCLEGMFGPSAGVLLDFGLKPRKKPERTVADKLEAVEKNVATRAARKTMGPRQKKNIHGTVPAATPPDDEGGGKPG